MYLGLYHNYTCIVSIGKSYYFVPYTGHPEEACIEWSHRLLPDQASTEDNQVPAAAQRLALLL